MSGKEYGFDVAGARLRVRECGAPGGRPLVFLHGGAGSGEDWSPILDAFSDFRCILPDSRGHGGSTLGERALSYPLLADDAEALITGLGLSDPCIIGHSDGGVTGLHLAARQTCQIAGLVAIAARGAPPGADKIRDIYTQITAASWRARFPEAVARYERLNPTPDFDRLLENLLAMWRNTAPGNYPDALVEAIACPTLVLGGDRDHLIARGETIALATRIPGAALGIIPFASHVPHWEHPARIVPYLRALIDQATG